MEFKDDDVFGSAAPVDQKKQPEFKEGDVFASKVPSSRAPARNLEEWKKDPSRGFSFGTREEQKAAALSPAAGRTLAGTGSFADTFTLGGLNWVPAFAAKGLGAAKTPGYERYADMPVSSIKKEADKITGAASEMYPVESGVGTVAGIGAGMATPVVKGPAALMKSVTSPYARSAVTGGLTGLTYGAGEGFLREGDLKQAAESGVMGLASGAAMSPLLEKAFGSIARLVSRGEKAVDPVTGALSPKAMQIAQDAGLSQEQINYLGPTLIESFKKHGMRPEAVRAAQFAKEGITPTVGMVTQDAEQLAREAQFGLPSYQRVTQEAGEAAQRAAPTTLTPDQAAEAAAQKIKDVGTAREAAAAKAYKKAGAAIGLFDPSVIENTGTKILKMSASDPKNVTWLRDPAITRAAKEIDQVLGTPLETEFGTVTHQSFGAVEGARQILNKYYRDATDPAVQAGFKEMISKFDDNIENAINNNLYSGDPKALQMFKNARKLWSNYQKRFGASTEGLDSGRLVSQIVNDNKTPEEVANALFNMKSADKTLKATAAKTLRQLEKGLGPNSTEYEKIKMAYVNKLMTPNANLAGPIAFSKVAQNIDDFLNGSTREVSRSMLSQSERFALENFGKVMKMASSTQPPDPEKTYGLIKSALLTAGPAAGSAMMYQLSMLDPKLAMTLGISGSILGGIRSAKHREGFQRMMANRLFEGRGPAPEVPSAATIAPRIFPGMQPEEEVRADGGRVARANGGKVDVEKGVRALMMAVEAAKKKVNLSTESLLEQPDEHVAQALNAAKRHI